MRLTKYKTIDEILEDLVPVFLHHNGLVPMDWTPARKAVMFSLSEDFAERLILLVTNLSQKVIESVYVSPSHFIKAAHNFPNACKSLHYDKQLVLSTYIDLCNAAVIRWNVEANKIAEDVCNFIFSNCTPKVREEIAYLNSLTRAFSEAIYCDDHTIGGDICGPIKYANKTLLVREYKRLRPVELFDLLAEFEIKSIIIYCLYDDNNIAVDLIGNLTQCQNMVNTLQKYYIEVIDEKDQKHIVTEEWQLQRLILYLETWLKRVIVYYKKLSEQKKYELLFQCEFYAFKPLFDYYNMGWVPQSYDIKTSSSEQPKGIKLREKLATLTNKEDIVQCTKAILDPRL